MKNLSLKLKLLIAGAIAIVLLLVAISIGQLISIHNKQKEIDKLNKQLENLVNQIAGTNPPPNNTSLIITKDGIVAEMKLWLFL